MNERKIVAMLPDRVSRSVVLPLPEAPMRASTWPGRAQPVIWSRISLCLPFSSTAVTETSRQVRKTPRPVSCSPPMLLATLSGVVGLGVGVQRRTTGDAAAIVSFSQRWEAVQA
jgi:hypothetical protein